MSEHDVSSNEEQTDGNLSSVMYEPAMTAAFTLADDLEFRGKNMRCHLTIIKWIGILILATTCTIPGFVILTHTECSFPASDDPGMKPDLNRTACVFVKQFYLQDRLYATVCNQNGYVFVDLRQFINGSATIIGVDLAQIQWLSLKQQMAGIDTAITEARTYWKNLKLYEGSRPVS
jgi:hypothetical protein